MKKMKRGGNTTIKLYRYEIKKEKFTFKEDEAKVIKFICDSFIQGIKCRPMIQRLKIQGIK